MKKCPKCKIYKNFNNFCKDISRIDGLSCWCKKCVDQKRKERLMKRGGYRPKKYYPIINNKKECSGCHKIRNIKHFCISRRSASGLNRLCRQCCSKERNSIKWKEWRRQYNKKYRKLNKKSARKKYLKNRKNILKKLKLIRG